MIEELLKERKLPSIKEFADNNRDDFQRKIGELFCRYEYGFLPDNPDSVTWENVSEEKDFCAGKAVFTTVRLSVSIKGKSFSFPVYCVVPKKGDVHPAIVHIAFRNNVPDIYMPTEEICDNGFAVFSFCYKEVTSDDGDFTNGLAGAVFNGGERGRHGAGKIALWAWASMRVMDYIESRGDIDMKKVAVLGHSRLGKTALLAGSCDERFSYVISNDSGCCGAALSRGKSGETIDNIREKFPFWFCEGFLEYKSPEELPFDQHWLLASIAPRKLYVASADGDLWADPLSEHLSFCAACEIYKLFGVTKAPEKLLSGGESFENEKMGRHVRTGTHYLSRYDWQKIMQFIIHH